MLLVPAMIVMIAIAFIIVVRVMASRYKKIAPNKVGIFYGRKYTWIDPTDGKSKKTGVQDRGRRRITAVADCRRASRVVHGGLPD